MRCIYEFVLENDVSAPLELGTGWGATSCVMAAALEERGRGRLLTIDLHLTPPVNVRALMDHVGLPAKYVEPVVDKLGYDWYLPELIKKQTHQGVCEPLFDFCLLDGAHEWVPDALAFTLASRLIKPGAWIAIDDLNFNLRMVDDWQRFFPNHSDRELDTFQMRMVWEIMVLPNTEFANFRVTHDGRIGWAQRLSAPRRLSTGVGSVLQTLRRRARNA
ncbi:MAG: class I SAM-dependent methyltransferase [Nitrososphaerales archaeon]